MWYMWLWVLLWTVSSFLWFKKKRLEDKHQLLANLEEAKHTQWRLKQQRDRYKELFELHMSKNAEFERQRDQIWDIYRRSGTEAGNAQQMLMRELGVSVKQLNAARQKLGQPPVEISRELQQVVNQFSEQHGSKRPEELAVNE